MSETNPKPPTPPGQPVLGHTLPFMRDTFGFVEESVGSTGDVFRAQLLGKDVYYVAHPEYVKTVLLDRDTFAKLDDFEVAFGEALLSVEGEQWRRQRHAMEKFFSPRRIQDHVETMATATCSRLDGWESDSTIRVDEEMRAVALHNLFEVVLGHSLGDDEIDDLADAAYALNLWFKPSTWALPDWVPTPARWKFRQGSAELREQARHLLTDSGDSPRDDSLLATLVTLREDPESGFDRSEVLDQVVGMLFAGHETTALAMTYALHQLGTRPEVADRFYAEIDDEVDGAVSLANLKEMDYLDRIVSETLRLYPPVHTIPRVTTRAVDVGGHTIPEAAQVLVTVWNIHHDSRFYENPLTFDSNRWQQTTPRERGYAFIPFGSGPRICIGRHFARLEIKTVLATIGQRYRLNAEGDVEVSPQMTSQPTSSVPIRISEHG